MKKIIILSLSLILIFCLCPNHVNADIVSLKAIIKAETPNKISLTVKDSVKHSKYIIYIRNNLNQKYTPFYKAVKQKNGKYALYKKQGGTWIYKRTVSTISFTHGQLSSGKTYRYKVVAYKGKIKKATKIASFKAGKVQSRATIVSGGDILMGFSAQDASYKNNEYDFSGCFPDDVTNYFKNADYSVLNMECVLEDNY